MTVFKYKYYLLCLLFIVLSTSCVDRLDFIGDTQSGQLVVYGQINDVDEIQRVNLGITKNFGLAQEPLSGASVTLRTDRGDIFPYQIMGDGIYQLTDFKAEPNIGYFLNISTGGNIYTSDTTFLPELLGRDELRTSFSFEPIRSTKDEPVMTVFADTEIPSGRDPLYLRWSVEETYLWRLYEIPASGPGLPPPSVCFISDVVEPTRINLFTNSGTGTTSTSQIMAKRLVDNSFISPFFVTVKQLSISRKTFEYWQQIRIMLNNQGSLFDVPPAPVFGNVSNPADPDERVLGYFEVAKAHLTRIYILPDQVPFFLPRPCAVFPGNTQGFVNPECMNCAERARGRDWSFQAPQWWRFD